MKRYSSVYIPKVHTSLTQQQIQDIFEGDFHGTPYEFTVSRIDFHEKEGMWNSCFVHFNWDSDAVHKTKFVDQVYNEGGNHLYYGDYNGPKHYLRVYPNKHRKFEGAWVESEEEAEIEPNRLETLVLNQGEKIKDLENLVFVLSEQVQNFEDYFRTKMMLNEVEDTVKTLTECAEE